MKTHSRAALSWAAVRGLRERHRRALKAGTSLNQTAEARKLGVNMTTVKRILRGETWKETNGNPKKR